MLSKIKSLLGKLVEVGQARGWTAPDPRIMEALKALEARIDALEKEWHAPTTPPPTA